jgi:hypothetical protein
MVDHARARFTLTLSDLAEQAGSSGFLRGVSVGFLSSFYVFDKGVTDGQIAAAIGRFLIAHPVEAAALLGLAVGTAIYLAGKLVVEKREESAKAHAMRARLGLIAEAPGVGAAQP